MNNLISTSTKTLIYLLILSIVGVIISTKFINSFQDDLYNLEYPSYFPKPTYNFKENPLTKSKFDLGRALFYEVLLSKDSTISCSSCHSVFNSFAHIDHKLSHGIYDLVGNRNAPALINLAWNNRFMWDGAIHNLDVQALGPISNPIEMDDNLQDIIKKLSITKIYPKLFYKAFKDSIITSERILKAIGSFQAAIVSYNSKYDSVRLGKSQFTEQENNGYAIFKKNCNSCHTEPLFTNGGFANNGLVPDNILKDYGRKNVTNNDNDALLFKIPTLRNLTYTYPYMHDGRFAKLNDVIHHYTNEKFKSNTLSPELQEKVKLSSNEKVDLLTFLLTLNDKSFTFNKNYTYPRDLYNK